MENYREKLNYLGVTYKNSEVDVRELFSLSDDEIEYAYSKFRSHYLDELFIISTCLRTEFYTNSSKQNLIKFINYIYKKFNKSIDLNNLNHKKDHECIEHIMKVTSGIESIVFGETQITNQIKNAYKLSLKKSSTGPILSKLIQSALELGKRIKNETSISKGSLSVPFAAVRKLKSYYKNYKNLNIFVIGAGITGKVTVNQLLSNDIKNITIFNRNIIRGKNLAKSFNINFKPLNDLYSNISKADVIITCTSANMNLLTLKDIKTISLSKKLFFIDLSVPRNIDSKISILPNTQIISVDDLKGVVDKFKESRKKELPFANNIISESKEEYLQWLSQLKVVPTIAGLKHFFEELQENELSKLKNKYDNKTIDAIDIFSKSLVKKILKEPIHKLKSENSDDQLKSNIIKVLQTIYPLKNSKDT